MILSDKQKAFLMNVAKLETAEGQTAGGKTTIGALKLGLRIKASTKRQHFIAGLDIGTVEKNILNKENGFLEMFGNDVQYFGNGNARDKLPHLELKSIHGLKIIYVFGYSDAARWMKALGSQFGCGLIDEGNVADMNFVREVCMRSDYVLITLNPDNPDLEIYKEYINHCRPLQQFAEDLPTEMRKQLETQPAFDGWVHWYFTMDDNPTLTEEKKKQIVMNVPKGTKTYYAKILGLRMRSEGLIVEIPDNKIIPLESFNWLPNEKIICINCGLDSGLNNDATALTTRLLTTAGRNIKLPSYYDLHTTGIRTNSQQAVNIEKWLDYWLSVFNCLDPNVVRICGDSAALTQDLLYELNMNTKYNAIKAPSKDIMRDTQRYIGMVQSEGYLIVNAGFRDPNNPKIKLGEFDPSITEPNNWTWDKRTGKPTDGNDHTIDADKYSLNLDFGGF